MKQENYKYKNYDKALKKQKERYYKRVLKMLNEDIYKCYFLTFTFNEKTLKRTAKETRLRIIKSFLNNQASDYVLNCDYGKENKREHYHAFILSRYKVIVLSAFEYGFINIRKPHKTLNKNYDESPKETAENLTKHAFKETTKESKIIYSRKALKIDKSFKNQAIKKLKDYQNSITGKTNKQIFIDSLNSDEKNKTDLIELEKQIGLYGIEEEIQDIYKNQA